ncbi:Tryptophan synthase alpha chain [compost metagenome]
MNKVAFNLLDLTFEQLKEANKTALIPFITVGDPNPEITVDIIATLEEAGADVIELGVPYSDPLADGPVIQRASQRALEYEITIETCIETAKAARNQGVKLPFVLFTYFNPVLQYESLQAFFNAVSEAGISGLIIPDLPFEESEEILALADQANIYLIPLIAPTSNERIAAILSRARGFIYCVSSLGVTGERASFYNGVHAFIENVKSITALPVAVGFGISTNEQVREFAEVCDGVVVGSAIVRKIEESIPLLIQDETKSEGLLQIRNFVSQLKS